jgi:hypothetical protein
LIHKVANEVHTEIKGEKPATWSGFSSFYQCLGIHDRSMSFIHADHVFLHLGDLLLAKHDPKTKKQPESSKET